MLYSAFELMGTLLNRLYTMMDSVELLPNVTLAHVFIGLMALSFLIPALKVLFKLRGSDNK